MPSYDDDEEDDEFNQQFYSDYLVETIHDAPDQGNLPFAAKNNPFSVEFLEELWWARHNNGLQS